MKGGEALGTEIGQTSRDQFAPVRAPDSDPGSIRSPHTNTHVLFAHISMHDPLDFPFSMPMYLLPFRSLFPRFLSLDLPYPRVGTLLPRDIRHRKSCCVAR